MQGLKFQTITPPPHLPTDSLKGKEKQSVEKNRPILLDDKFTETYNFIFLKKENKILIIITRIIRIKKYEYSTSEKDSLEYYFNHQMEKNKLRRGRRLTKGQGLSGPTGGIYF